MKIIQTSKGDIEILNPSVDLLRKLRAALPFGICQISPDADGAQFGVVMQCGEREVYCIKQQPVEREKEAALALFGVQNWMCAEALCRYVKDGFSGGYLAAPYLRPRDGGLVEPGISHFIFPSADGIEARNHPFARAFDSQFGHGATVMFTDFLKHFRQAFAETEFTVPEYFGLDVRPRLHLGTLAMYFMCLGQDIICLRANLREREDVSWNIFAAAGIKTVYHIPSVPMQITEDDLAITKGIPAE